MTVNSFMQTLPHIDPFMQAIIEGDIDKLDSMFISDPELTLEKICASNFYAFRIADQLGHIHVMNKLMCIAPEAAEDMVSTLHTNTTSNELSTLMDDFKRTMDSAYNFSPEASHLITKKEYEIVIKFAIAKGHITCLELLLFILPDKVKDIMSNENFDLLIKASQSGHLPAFERMIALAPDSAHVFINTNQFHEFQIMALHGQQQTMESFIKHFSDTQRQAMLEANNFRAFRWAALNGHLDIIEKFIELSPSKIKDMVNADEYTVFQLAALKGHIHVIERLLTLAPEKAREMLCANTCLAFRFASLSGNLEILNRFIKIIPDDIMLLVTANNYGPFIGAAQNGHLDVIDKLIALAPDKVQEMISAQDFYAFAIAAENGHLDVIDKLIALAPDKVQEMISAHDFIAFIIAARGGHLDVIDKLIALAPDKVQEMISAQDFYAFAMAAKNGHLDVISKLLCFDHVFAYAEMNFDEYVRGFIEQQFTALNKAKADFETSNPNGIFDITDTQQARLYFYMIRQLIRNKRPGSIEKIHLLLSIPSVRALAHQEVTPKEPNELLRLALSLNHRDEVQMLIQIPAVHDLAERNNFYSQDQIFGIDYQVAAQDHESSMRALTPGEEKALERVKLRYQPEIEHRGETAIMQDLKEYLVKRFEAHPAIVQNEDGQMIPLPLNFDAWQTLAQNFSDDMKASALVAYYQHPDHTAYRYLSKPNPWINKDSPYVNQNETGAWSTFEQYQPLISLCYLAARDETTEAIDGWSIEGRIDHFIKELGFIGRAHNWVERLNPNTHCKEEYDDLKADNPSCYSGTKKRLFQSVQGHPLLCLLTKDMIAQEVRSVVRAHFINRINDENCDELLQAWEIIIEGGSDDANILEQLNFSNEEQALHIASISKDLHEKYGSQFTAELHAYLVSKFNIGKHFRNLAEQYGAQTGLIDILTCRQEQRSSTPCFR